jgi:hypothetical protein
MHPKQTGAPESALCWSKVCSVMVRKVFSSEIFDPTAEIVLSSVGIYFTIHIFNGSRLTRRLRRSSPLRLASQPHRTLLLMALPGPNWRPAMFLRT